MTSSQSVRLVQSILASISVEGLGAWDFCPQVRYALFSYDILSLSYSWPYLASRLSIVATRSLNSGSTKRRVSFTMRPSRSMRTLRVIPDLRRA